MRVVVGGSGLAGRLVCVGPDVTVGTPETGTVLAVTVALMELLSVGVSVAAGDRVRVRVDG